MHDQLPHNVMSCAQLGIGALETLLQKYQMNLIVVDDNAALPGSFWGDPEAGIITNTLFIRPHTPLQSALHETCHYICMDEQRRRRLHTDAGGGYDEENAVCYLQILLAAELESMGTDICSRRMMQDMDSWGYSFRLGSAGSWFAEDAEDARNWLIDNKLITAEASPTWRLRI